MQDGHVNRLECTLLRESWGPYEGDVNQKHFRGVCISGTVVCSQSRPVSREGKPIVNYSSFRIAPSLLLSQLENSKCF